MQVCIHTCGSQRWTLVSYQFLSILFILIAHYDDDDDDDEGVCVHVSGGNTCAVVRVWRSKDNFHGTGSFVPLLHGFQVLNPGHQAWGQPSLPNEFIFWPSLPSSYFEKQSLAEPGACCFVDAG